MEIMCIIFKKDILQKCSQTVSLSLDLTRTNSTQPSGLMKSTRKPMNSSEGTARGLGDRPLTRYSRLSERSRKLATGCGYYPGMSTTRIKRTTTSLSAAGMDLLKLRKIDPMSSTPTGFLTT